MDYLCQQLGQLDIASDLPDNFHRREVVINRAMDVRSACMLYLASHIRHDATSFGTMGTICAPFIHLIAGKVAKIFFTGDEPITDAASYLKSSIDSFNNALVNLNLRIVIKVYELLKGMPFSLQ
jgi:hypothetical protein